MNTPIKPWQAPHAQGLSLPGVYVPPIPTAGIITSVTSAGAFPVMTSMPNKHYRKNTLLRIDRGGPLVNHVMSVADGFPAIGGFPNDAFSALRAFRLRIAYEPMPTGYHVPKTLMP